MSNNFTKSDYVNNFRSRGTITFFPNTNDKGFLYILNDKSNILSEDYLSTFIQPGFLLVNSNCSPNISIGNDNKNTLMLLKKKIKTRQ